MSSALKAKDPKSAEPQKPKVLVFGEPGVGKTWWALDGFPAPYYIDTEGGAKLSHYTDKLSKVGGAYLGPEDGSQDFETIIGQVKALATEKHRFGTVVIDSITKPFNLAITSEAERLGDKNAFGADKKPAIAMMRRLVSWIDRIDMNVILIAHQKGLWGNNAQGERVQIGDTFDCHDKLAYELDLSIQVVKRGAARFGIVKKSRLTGFPDNANFPWTFDEFAQRWGKDIIAAKAKQITLADEATIAEIKRMLGLLKLDDGDVQKALAKDGVDSIQDLSVEQAANWVKRLNKVIAGK